jgi:hypothetical protein
MAHTYTRTVTVVPSDDNYEWQNPAGWIAINQVGSSDTWEITVSDNTTNQNRSAVLTVNHSDGATTNSITVNQAGSGSVQASPTPTPTSSASATPTPTPTPSESQPASSIGIILDDHNSSGTRFTGSYPLSLGFTLTGVGENIFPTNPDDVSNSNMSVVMDGNVSGSSQQTSKGQVTTWTGTYTINPTISAENDIDGDIALTFGGLTVGESFFYRIQGTSLPEEDDDEGVKFNG